MATFTNTPEPIGANRTRLKEMRDQYVAEGYAGPIRLLSLRECRRLLRAIVDASSGTPLGWDKGHAASSRAFYEIATHPAIVEILTALLGEDVILWGASLQTRSPGAVHPWHSDIETSCAAPGKTVSVWIGIQNTSSDSSLLVMPYSHRFGVSLQEVRHRFGRRRDDATGDEVLGWARERDPRSNLAKLGITDGEALFFDGQLWHSSDNRSRKTRQALLVQYATPDTPIRIPDLNYLNWPFQYLDQPKPPCLMVNGTATTGVNRIVSAPEASKAGSNCQLTSRIYSLRVPLTPDEEKGWKPYPMFRGSTAGLGNLSCHASVLTHGHSPHPPHTHVEEELLLLLSGEADLVLPAEPTTSADKRKRLRFGQFVFYPPHFPHTLETVSEAPANYLMFKWYSGRSGADSPLRFGQFNFFDHLSDASAEVGFRPRLVFEGPTAYLQKLHCHTSTLSPGAGYEPHVDAYDVAIIVLEGEIETVGERVGPHTVIFYPAGEPHGVRNSGEAACKYVVFEFHGTQKRMDDRQSFSRLSSLLTKLTDGQRWKRKLKRLSQSLIAGVRSKANEN